MRNVKTALPLLSAILLTLAVAPKLAYAQTHEQVVSSGQAIMPEGFWAYNAITTLLNQKIGVLAEGEYPYTFKKNRSRFEAAVFVARAVDRINVAVLEGRRPLSEAEKNAPIFRPANLQLLHRLVTEFAREMEILGADAAVVKKRVEQMEDIARAQNPGTPFADVPTTHWAYESLEKLRRAGIIVGYPGGMLHSPSAAPGVQSTGGVAPKTPR